MNSTLTMRGRILRAVYAEGLGQLLNITIRVLLVPLFLLAWGAQSYGEWLVLTATAGWFGLADLGGQLYFINRMTESWARKEILEFQEIFSTGICFFSITSFTLMLVGAAVISMGNITEWLGVVSTTSNQVYLILVLMCFRVLASLPLGMLLGVYRATGSQATSVMYGNLLLVIQLISSSAVLWLGGGMVLMALVDVISLLIVSGIVTLDLSRRVQEGVRLFRITKPKIQILKQGFVPSMHFLGIQFAMAAMIQGSVIVAAKSMGPFEVVIFSTMRAVANVVSRFLGMLSHSVWPEFTRLQSQNEYERMQVLFKKVLLVSVLVGLLYLVLIQYFGQGAFEFWVKDKLPYDEFLMLLMGVLVVLTNNWTLGGNLLMATNRHKLYALIQVPINLISLLIGYLAARAFGLEGLLAGLIIGQSVPMLVLTTWLLAVNNWNLASRYLLLQSVMVGLLLPLFFTDWGGCAALLIATILGVFSLRRFANEHCVLHKDITGV